MNIAAILQNLAKQQPHIPAIIDTYHHRQRTISFADLEKLTAIGAALLKQTGLQPGDAVLIFYPMSAELYIVLAALFRLGLVAMFLDPSASKNHIDECYYLYSPKALIASSKAHLLQIRSPALRHIPIKLTIGLPIPGTRLWHTDKLTPYLQIHPCNAATPALITFTSGSTGKPKAALRTHGFLLAQYQALIETLQLTPQQIDLATLPIFVLANLASGMTSVIPNVDLRFPGKINPAAVIAQIQTYKPARTVASPAFLERLADYSIQKHLTFSSLEKIFVGGAPIMPRLLTKLKQMAPNAEVAMVYGSTEAEPIATISYLDIHPEDINATFTGGGLLVGFPVSTIQLKIFPRQWGTPIQPHTNAEFIAACLPVNTPGEIVVSGNHVLPGYLYAKGDEESKFKVDGIPWHRTGDTGYLDSQGRLWLLGRCVGCIDDHHGTLYPLMVEGIVNSFAGIHRAAVVTHQRKRVLLVELYPNAVVDWAFLQQSLASLKIEGIYVSKIPVDRRHNSKIDYRALFTLKT